jgi:Immunoglobulin I-set domain
LNQTVEVGRDVVLFCNATTDPSERRKLEITWMRYGYPIDFQSENNVALYTVDKSLRITHARIGNTGSYTCNATNGLDWDAATVQVTVRGT